MSNGQEELVRNVSRFAVEVSGHSHLVFSRLKQFNEVVFWERPEIPDIPVTDRDVYVNLQVHDRIDLAAALLYRDPIFWWVFSVANDIRLPPLQMNPGQLFRVLDSAVLLDIMRGGQSKP